MKKILLAEDDADFAGVLTQYLRLHGFDVTYCKDGEEAFKRFQEETFDIGVLDVMMPKMDGFTLAENIIEVIPDTPFVFLTARTLKEDRLKGLKLGADDYIVKPFDVDELVLRLENILKRSKKSTVADEGKIMISSYMFDGGRLELIHKGKIQKLTIKEATLISYLYRNRNRIIKRDDILTAVWGSDDFFSGRSMDVYISRLRKYFYADSRINIVSTRHIGLELRVAE